MLLLEPAETQFDLRWSMFGVPVRVHPMFWLISAFLGWDLMNRENGLRLLLLWIICVFVSILLHELGHVVVGRLFGSRGHIVLYSFGGLAIGSKALASRWQRIAVSLAGPLVQLLLFGILRAIVFWDIEDILRGPEPIRRAVGFLLEINLYWALLNLLPVWPLDGGQVSREVFEWLMPSNGVRACLWLSLITAGALAVNSLMAETGRPLIPHLPAGGLYMALLFGMLALNNYFELQQTPRSSSGWWENRRGWNDDQDDWRP
jgi:stage IV sporulation protein FB